MSNESKISNALSGVLVEVIKSGYDIEALVGEVEYGLMGGKSYAPASAHEKPKQVEILKESLAYAQKLIEIDTGKA